jgi:hypothetical protein
MKFDPVFLPDDRRLDGKTSMTFLKHYDSCPRSGFLYAKYKGEASTPAMVRGSAFHAIVQAAINLMMDTDEGTIPAEVVKVLVNEKLAEHPVPTAEHDAIREMAYRWAEEFRMVRNDVIACETFLTLEVGGYEVRGIVDYATLIEDGRAVLVKDWKTSRAAPSFEDVARKRPDGTYAAKNFQLVLYALLLAFGTVYEEGYRVATQAQRFDLEFVYPAIPDSTGRMLTRPMSLTRLELEEYRASLDALLERVERSEDSGDWPAVVSDDACGICPCAGECPIPAQVRAERGEIGTASYARYLAEMLDQGARLDRQTRANLKEWAKQHGPIRYGKDKVMDFVPQTTERVDKDGLFAALERGETPDRAHFVKVVNSTPFKGRTLSADELAGEDEAA